MDILEKIINDSEFLKSLNYDDYIEDEYVNKKIYLENILPFKLNLLIKFYNNKQYITNKQLIELANQLEFIINIRFYEILIIIKFKNLNQKLLDNLKGEGINILKLSVIYKKEEEENICKYFIEYDYFDQFVNSYKLISKNLEIYQVKLLYRALLYYACNKNRLNIIIFLCENKIYKNYNLSHPSEIANNFGKIIDLNLSDYYGIINIFEKIIELKYLEAFIILSKYYPECIIEDVLIDTFISTNSIDIFKFVILHKTDLKNILRYLMTAIYYIRFEIADFILEIMLKNNIDYNSFFSNIYIKRIILEHFNIIKKLEWLYNNSLIKYNFYDINFLNIIIDLDCPDILEWLYEKNNNIINYFIDTNIIKKLFIEGDFRLIKWLYKLIGNKLFNFYSLLDIYNYNLDLLDNNLYTPMILIWICDTENIWIDNTYENLLINFKKLLKEYYIGK